MYRRGSKEVVWVEGRSCYRQTDLQQDIAWHLHGACNFNAVRLDVGAPISLSDQTSLHNCERSANL